MRLQEALDKADAQRTNMITRPEKIAWISELDGLIWSEIVSKHNLLPGEEIRLSVMPEYDEDTEPGKKLLVPFPYDEVYTYWLMAKIDERHAEAERYNNDKLTFNGYYEQFSDWWTRNHMPKTNVREIML